MRSSKKDYPGTMASIVKASFLGLEYRLDDKSYNLPPALLGKYDVLRSISEPSSELERLVKNLPRDFRTVARSELYRKDGGWIQQGISSRSFCEVAEGKKSFLVPYLGDISVGIDTSTMDSTWTVICICCFDDPERAFHYLDKHLKIPRAKNPSELKWRQLNETYKETIYDNLNLLLKLSCKALLVIKTNALISPVEKLSDIFIKTIDGCFSGYEIYQEGAREELRKIFFALTNKIPVHCDPDFTPLTTDKVVRFLVKTLAHNESYLPLHVGLKSEESHPIQIADLICGCLKRVLKEKEYESHRIVPLPFYKKLKGKTKDAKAYFWVNEMSTQASAAVETLSRTLPPLEAP